MNELKPITSLNGINVNGYEIIFNQSLPLPNGIDVQKFTELVWEVIKK